MRGLNVLTVIIIIAEWITIDSKYIPTTHIHQRGWPLRSHTGPLSSRALWVPGRLRSRSPGPVWPQQRNRGSGLQPDSRMSVRRTTLRPDSIMPQRKVPQNSLAINDKDITRTETSRMRLFPHNVLALQQSRSRSEPFQRKHIISVSSSKDGDRSITLTNRHLPFMTAFQRMRDRPITKSRGFESSKDEANSGLHLRMDIGGDRLSKRPMHNIVIKTKSGKRIDISHSMDRTNIFLNGKSNHRGRLTDVGSLTMNQPGTPSVNRTSSENQHKGPHSIFKETPSEIQLDLNNITVTSSSTPIVMTTLPMASQTLTTSTHLPPAIGVQSQQPLTSMATGITTAKQFATTSSPIPNTATNKGTNTSGNPISLVPNVNTSTAKGFKATSSDTAVISTQTLETSNHATQNVATQSSKGASIISTGEVISVGNASTISPASTNAITSGERLTHSNDRHMTTDGSNKHLFGGIQHPSSSTRLSNSRTRDITSSDHSENGTSNDHSKVSISNDQSEDDNPDDVSRDSSHSKSKGDVFDGGMDDNPDYQDGSDK